MSAEFIDLDKPAHQTVDNIYYCMPLSDDRVHWVDNKVSLHGCVDEMLQVC